MIDDMNTLPPNDTNAIHAHLGALSTVYVQVYSALRPKLKNARYATVLERAGQKFGTLSSYL
jgi:hypothetical protein